MTGPQSHLLFHFAVPGLPIAKGRARTRVVQAKGKTFASHYTPASTRDYENQVKACALEAMKGQPPHLVPIDLLVEFRFPIADSWPKWKRDAAAAGLVHHTAKPDCSNLVKAIEDACNKVLWADDGQVVGCITDKVWTVGQPGVIVRGYRRAGALFQSSKAECDEATKGYAPAVRVEHLGLGHRIRRLQLVGGGK